MMDKNLIAALIVFAEDHGVYTVADLEEFTAYVDRSMLRGLPNGMGGFIGEDDDE